jgi:tetratricopeptide (TPR) repeat protein
MEDFKIIEKFLDGTMTEEEKSAFEERCKTDESLNHILMEMDSLVEGIKKSAAHTTQSEKEDRLRIFREMSEFELSEPEMSQISSSPGKVIPLYQKSWAVATAASFILVAALTFYFIKDQTPRNEKLYIAYFEVFDSPGSGLTRGSNSVTIKTEAYEAYDNGDYTVAVKLFEQILQEKEDPITQLCLGNAYLSQNDPAHAEKIFNEMLEKQTELITQAKWYLALTYLKQNKIERTKATLWEISNSSTYGEKARKLLNELD